MEESMSRGRPRITEGKIYRRAGSTFWWMRYLDRNGRVHRESTGTTGEQEANRMLRDRLDGRDEGRLPAVLGGKNLTFNEWANWFLERRSKPPYRSEKTHLGNLNALKFLRPAFVANTLAEITSEAIEDHVEQWLRSGRRVKTKFGEQFRGRLRPATVHQEFRILRRILNVAVKKKTLAVNACRAMEFPVSLQVARKPH